MRKQIKLKISKLELKEGDLLLVEVGSKNIRPSQIQIKNIRDSIRSELYGLLARNINVLVYSYGGLSIKKPYGPSPTEIFMKGALFEKEKIIEMLQQKYNYMGTLPKDTTSVNPVLQAITTLKECLDAIKEVKK